MPKIIKDGAIINNDWQLVSKEQAEQGLPNGKAIIPLAAYLANIESLNKTETGVWLDGDDDSYQLKGLTDQLPVIALSFPVFSDGRSYSHAAIIREQLGFTGELRAIGDVLLDQLFYMKRVGFNAFDIREDLDIEKALNYFNTFTTPYQGAFDRKQHLFELRKS